ncbi:hypothetical protein [Halovivax gelatinilyticus]|uniref:hypothetical protein n=1 Tax=Halovivax gelatinilyticus TaxID=2961597 RepID=UPI0020CA634E|nr:hypothetical protein [Halovivax gelatinilyticus]
MSDDRYVHDPDAYDEDGERIDEDGALIDGDETTDSDRADADLMGTHPTAVDRTFGRRGWILVGVIIVAFVFAPLTIYLLPPGGESYLFALVLLPLLPAILLAVTAVWATTRP